MSLRTFYDFTFVDLLKFYAFLSFCAGEKGVAYTLITPADQNFSGDLVRNLVRFLIFIIFFFFTINLLLLDISATRLTVPTQQTFFCKLAIKYKTTCFQ